MPKLATFLRWAPFVGVLIAAALPQTAKADLIACDTVTGTTCTVNGTATTSFTVNFDALTQGNPSTELKATATFSNFSLLNGVFSTTLSLTNMTSQGTLSTANFDSIRLTGFGFDTTPDATSATATSSVFNTYLDATFPSFKTVDVCESSGPSCAGGGNGGLFPATSGITPSTDSFTLTLNGITGNQIDLGCDPTMVGACTSELFDVKFQTAFGSFEFANTSTTTTPVAEPTSVALLGGGLVMIGFVTRRRRTDRSA